MVPSSVVSSQLATLKPGRRRVVRSLRELLIHHLNLLIGHLPGKSIDRDMAVGPILLARPGSDERFDLTKRCGSGQRQAFGFMQSDPFIDYFT